MTDTQQPVAVPEPPAEQSATIAPAKTSSNLDELRAQVTHLCSDAGYDEMWGVKLSSNSEHVPTSIVLQKFLNANAQDLKAATEQLTGALKFRKGKRPLALLEKTYSARKFGDLGAVTVYHVAAEKVPEVFTWNMYGNVKDRMDEVFVPLNDFMDYRIALQELGISQLDLQNATEPISETHDPYKITQVHDYKNVSFFRQNANVKAASQEVIKQFSLAYPELLKEKYFVNVPAVMGWMYALIKLFVAPATAKKFHPMGDGSNLAAEFTIGKLDETQLPKEYGGKSGAGDGKMKDVSGLVDSLKFV